MSSLFATTVWQQRPCSRSLMDHHRPNAKTCANIEVFPSSIAHTFDICFTFVQRTYRNPHRTQPHAHSNTCNTYQLMLIFILCSSRPVSLWAGNVTSNDMCVSTFVFFCALRSVGISFTCKRARSTQQNTELSIVSLSLTLPLLFSFARTIIYYIFFSSLHSIESTRWHLKILKRHRLTCSIINHAYVFMFTCAMCPSLARVCVCVRVDSHVPHLAKVAHKL